MRYRVTIEGQEREVDVQIAPGGTARVTLDGKPVDADIRRIPGGVSLRIDGVVHDVLVGGAPESMQVAAGSHRATVSVESERSRSRKKRGGGDSAGNELRAPMPGRVVKILVAAGDEVEANQPLVVIEAMKMENELRSAAAVKIASVDVQEGQNVEGNTVLLRFA
ncbi:MAG: biotin/lipoyl-containing protein [Myxococcota bacterium]